MAQQEKTDNQVAAAVDNKEAPKTEAVVAAVEATEELTPEMKAIEKFLDAKLNGAMKNYNSRLEKSIQRQMAEVIATSTGVAVAAKPEDNNLRAQHEEALKKLGELEKAFNEEKTARTKVEQERLKADENSALTSVLATNNAVNIKGAMALLREEGKVFRNEQGQLMFHGAVKDLPLADGIKEWLATDDGSHYVASKGAAGSGGTSTSAPKNKNGKVSPEAANAEIGAWLQGATGKVSW